MKKVVFVLLSGALLTSVASAADKGSNSFAFYDAEYAVKSGAESRDWYVGGHLDLSFLNFTAKYSSKNYPAHEQFNKDEYSLENTFGMDVELGYRFTPNISADLELGTMGNFTDSDDGYTFKLNMPYVMGNGYYTFDNNVYVGLGVGGMLLTAKLTGGTFDSSADKTKVSVMLAANVGYSLAVASDVALDFRYRFSFINGLKRNTNWYEPAGGVVPEGLYDFSYKVNSILNNEFSVGIRYMF